MTIQLTVAGDLTSDMVAVLELFERPDFNRLISSIIGNYDTLNRNDDEVNTNPMETSTTSDNQV